jgi:hypothetical protein
MLRTGPRVPSGQYLSSIGDAASQTLDVLMVDVFYPVDAEGADLAPPAAPFETVLRQQYPPYKPLPDPSTRRTWPVQRPIAMGA